MAKVTMWSDENNDDVVLSIRVSEKAYRVLNECARTMSTPTNIVSVELAAKALLYVGIVSIEKHKREAEDGKD